MAESFVWLAMLRWDLMEKGNSTALTIMGKENDGHAVVVEDVVQQPQQIAQDTSEEIKNRHHNESYAPLLALLFLVLFFRDRVVTAPAPGGCRRRMRQRVSAPRFDGPKTARWPPDRTGEQVGYTCTFPVSGERWRCDKTGSSHRSTCFHSDGSCSTPAAFNWRSMWRSTSVLFT